MAGHLTVLDGAAAGRTAALSETGVSVVGSGHEADILLNAEGVCERHALIREQDGRWEVLDLGSVSGTQVNDCPVEGKVPLADGDEIQIGSVRLAFTIEAGEPFVEKDGDPRDPRTSEAPEAAPRTSAPASKRKSSVRMLFAVAAAACVVLILRQGQDDRGSPKGSRPAGGPDTGPARTPTEADGKRESGPAQRPRSAIDEAEARRRTGIFAETAAKEHKARNYEAAILLYREAMAANPDCNGDLLFARGLALTAAERYDEAIADLTEAMGCDCVCPEALRAARASAYLQKGELDKAILDCSEALRANPDFQDIYCLRGIAYFASGRMDNAKEDLDLAITRNPRDAEALRARSRVYEAMGEHAKAKEDLRRAEAIVAP